MKRNAVRFVIALSTVPLLVMGCSKDSKTADIVKTPDTVAGVVTTIGAPVAGTSDTTLITGGAADTAAGAADTTAATATTKAK